MDDLAPARPLLIGIPSIAPLFVGRSVGLFVDKIMLN